MKKLNPYMHLLFDNPNNSCMDSQVHKNNDFIIQIMKYLCKLISQKEDN